MADLRQLSDEDLESLVNGDLESLSDEALEIVAAGNVAEEESFQERRAEPEETPDSFVDTVRAAGLGAVEGIPGAKHGLAAVEAIARDPRNPMSVFFDDHTEVEGLDDFSEQYKKHLGEWNEEINRAEDTHPVATTVGDIASSLLLPGGGIKKLMGWGALSGISREEDIETPSELLTGNAFTAATTGAALAGVGSKVGSGISSGLHWFGSRLGLLANRTVGEAVGPVGVKEIKQLDTHVHKWYGGKKVKSAEATMEFVNDVMKETVEGQPLLKTFQSFEDTAVKASQLKSEIGDEIGKVILKANKAVKNKVESEEIYYRLRSEAGIESLLNSRVPDVRKTGEKLLSDLDEVFIKYKPREVNKATGEMLPKEIESFKPFSLLQLHQFKKDLASNVSKAFDRNRGDLTAKVQEQVSQVGVLSKVINDVVDSVGDDVIDKGTLKKLNRRWSNASIVEEMTRNAQYRAGGGALSVLKSAMGFKGLVVGAALKSGADVSNTVAMGTAMLFNEAIRSPSTPATLAVGLKKLSTVFKTDPNSPYLKRVLAGAALTTDEFRNSIMSSIGEISLMSEAVARTSEDVLTRQGDILSVLDYHSPDLAAQLRGAIELNDINGIGAIMDQVSKMPLAKKFIQDGVGWEGKVYSPEDKAMVLKDYMNKAREMGIPYVETIRVKKELSKPDPVDMPQMEPQGRQPQLRLPRDKNKHIY